MQIGRELSSKDLATQALQDLFEDGHLALHETRGGVSTQVYKVVFSSGKISFLRIAKEGESFGAEKQVHELLKAKGVLVPAVEYFEEQHPILGRSIMVTSAMPGGIMEVFRETPERISRDVLFEVGQQMALINSIPLPGYGIFLRKAAPTKLEARFTSYAAYMDGNTDAEGELLMGKGLLTIQEFEKLQRILAQGKALFSNVPTFLCHGDMDVSNMMLDTDKFAGFIDFGDAGAHTAAYDLAYIKLRNPYHYMTILEGYQTISEVPLGEDFAFDMLVHAVKVALRKVAAHSKRGTLKNTDHYALQFLKTELSKY